MAITETWLQTHISDAQIEIENYNSLRADRVNRKGGGALLYLHSTLVLRNDAKFGDGTCEGTICTIENMDAIVASIYRPPNAGLSSFENLMKFLSDYISEASIYRHMDLHIMGDINLPNIKWPTLEISRTHGEDYTKSANLILNCMSDHLLCQVVKVPTRGTNTLDVYMTNNDRQISSVKTADTTLSDHKLIRINLTHDPTVPLIRKTPNFDSNSYRCIDVKATLFSSIKSYLQSTGLN